MPSYVPSTESSCLVPLANSQFAPGSDSEPSPQSSEVSSNSSEFSPAVSLETPVALEVPYPRTRSRLKAPPAQKKHPQAGQSLKSPPGKFPQKTGTTRFRARKNGKQSQLRLCSTV